MELNHLADNARSVVEDSNENTQGLDWFLVGGAVRDALRGMEPEDFDFVVVGESTQSMQERGFKLIDNENNDTFPVFLNSNGEEFALARKEVSSGDGHTDFDVEAGPSVGLEEDLWRRDFTVNAMALSPDGQLIDRFGGRQDLENGDIMHVSDAFKDDPLRVLRGARFAARLGGEVLEPTQEIMAEVVPQIPSLPGERLRMEMMKAFKQAEEPRRFFDVLAEIGEEDTPSALDIAFPEVARLQQIPAGPPEHHAEGSAFEHTMMVLEEANKIRPNDETLLLMALAHDFGKQETPVDNWPSHHGHGEAGLSVIDRFNQRLSFSNEQVRAMKDAARHHMRLKHIENMNAKTVFDLVGETRFEDRLLDLMVADARGKEPPSVFDRELAADRFRRAREARREVTGQTLIDRGRDPEEMGGEKFGKHLRDARIAKMKRLK